MSWGDFPQIAQTFLSSKTFCEFVLFDSDLVALVTADWTREKPPSAKGTGMKPLRELH